MDTPWELEPADPPAAPPPPPPPPGPRDASASEARLAALERDVADVRQIQRHMIEQLAALQAAANLDAEVQPLAVRATAPAPVDPASAAEVEQLRQKNARLLADYERIEGEHQALKLLVESNRASRADVAALTADLRTGDPALDEKIAALLQERERLQQELERTKREATTRIKSLKTNLDKTKSEYDTVRIQRENLVRELQSRDAGDAAEPFKQRELTLAEITASEVFKTMLGNIRRTSREEVTLLHDAIVKLRAIDPAAYNLVLDLVAKQFKAANVENPLAMLPRG